MGFDSMLTFFEHLLKVFIFSLYYLRSSDEEIST